MAKLYKQKYNLNICGIRFFTVYGEWGRPDMFLFKLFKSFKKNKNFFLNNYGNHSRDFTYISDVIKFLIKISQKKKFDFFITNICSSNPVQIGELCDKFKLKYNFKKIKLIKKNKADVINTHGSNRNLKKITKINKFTTFEKGFNNTLKWYLKYSIHKF